MTYPTHLALALIIGKATGNYEVSLITSFAPDLDHLFSLYKHKLLKNPKEFFKITLQTNDPWKDQRGYLHNFINFLCISTLAYIINQPLGTIIFLAYFGHLLLDALDNSSYYPFFPNTKINIRGPIKYFSKAEFIFALILFVIYLIL